MKRKSESTIETVAKQKPAKAVRDRHFGVTTSPDLTHLTHSQMT